ncbi:MAG: hypothetical protein U1E50_17725 [Caulobacteraceae bacterium]
MLTRRGLTLGLGLALAAGRAHAATGARLEVALIGDACRAEVFRRLVLQLRGTVTSDDSGAKRLAARGAALDITCIRDGEDPVGFATQARTAHIALIAMDATEGPRALIREHLLITRQTRAPAHLMVANIKALRGAAPSDAADLISSEIEEALALAALYLPEGHVPEVLFDEEMPGLDEMDWPHGLADAARFLTVLPAAPKPRRELRLAHGATLAFYLLSAQERRGRSSQLEAGHHFLLWSEGKTSVARLGGSAQTYFAPGADAEALFGFEEPLPMAEGSGVLLIRDETLIGVGAVKSLAALPS